MILSPADKVVLKTSHTASGLQDSLLSITQADSHSAVNSALARMRLYLLNDKLALKQGTSSSISILRNLEWQTALGRFVQLLKMQPLNMYYSELLFFTSFMILCTLYQLKLPFFS